MPELNEKLLNRLGIAEAMAHRAKATAGRLQQAAAKHHDAQNADIDALGKQIEAAGVGRDEDAENRYCRALVARGHMAQAHHLAGLDAARMPEVGASLEKGRINRAQIEAAGQGAMDFEEEQHPRAAEGTAGRYKPGEFVPKGETQGPAAEEKPDHEKEPWELPRSSMKSSSDYDKSYMSNYVDAAGNKTASSRTTPAREEEIPLGTWRRDDYKGIHGTEVEQLRELDPNDLIPSEDTDATKKADVERYTEWAKEGKKAPPIHVVETDSGKLKISNGHRRWLSAKAAGTKIRAWVSPAATTGKVDSAGKPMKTGLTHELAIHHAIEAGHRVPDEVLQDYPELKSKHDQKRKEALRDAAQSAQEDGHPGLAEAQEKAAEAQAEREPWQQTKKEFEADGDLVYHGGSGEYEIETDRGGKATGNVTSGFGAFFTPHKAEAERYVKGFHGGKGAVNVAKLDLKNPYKMPFEEFDDISKVDWNGLGLQGGRDEIRRRVAKIKRDLMGAGYDGIIVGKPGQKVPPRFPTALPNDERSQEIIAFHKDSIIQHRKAVSQALQEGKPVPPEVLADYPDLERNVARGGDLNKAVRRTFHSPGQAAMEFDEEQHPREAKGATMAGYKPGEFVPKDTPEKAPFEVWARTGPDLPVEEVEDLGSTGYYGDGKVKIDRRQAEILKRHKRYGVNAFDAVVTHEKMHHVWHMAFGELSSKGNPAWKEAIQELEALPMSEGVDLAASQRTSLIERAVETMTADSLAPDRLSAAERDWCKRVKERAYQSTLHPKLSVRRPWPGQPETLDPKEDWKKNGVRSKSFKSWFGDWETDPKNASKVIDKEGQPAENYPADFSKVKGDDGKPRLVYHGTSQFAFSTFDPSKLDANALYGPGFYFTEDQSVAKSYHDKDSAPTRVNRPLTDQDIDKLYDFLENSDEPKDARWSNVRTFYMAHIRMGRKAGNAPAKIADMLSREDGDLADKMLEAVGAGREKSTGHLFSVYLNIRSPFNMDSPADDQTRQKVGDALRGMGIDPGDRLQPREKGDGDDLFKAISDLCLDAQSRGEEVAESWESTKAGAVEVLTKAGFDGITHIGGQRMGGGHLHSVWIAFDPHQIKSVENEGTFDPTNPDINKAVRRPFVPPDMPRWRGPRPSPNSYLPLNGVEDREKFLAMAKEMAAGTWTWDKPLIRCGDQLLSGSHRYAAAQTAGVPVETMDADDLFKEGGLDFRETWKLHAQPYTSWLNNMDAALKCLPPQLLAKYGVDLG